MTKKKERIWGYVESCAGGAAVALHLHGAKRALMPYQGSKWTYRKAIAALYEEMGFPGRPEQTFLNDPGPWHIAHQGLLEKRESVLGALGVYANGDPRGIYTSLLGDSLCASPALNAADFLFLQRLAYNCKAVTVREGRWVSPGFNPTSAYGTPATERFGAVLSAPTKATDHDWKIGEAASGELVQIQVETLASRAEAQAEARKLQEFGQVALLADGPDTRLVIDSTPDKADTVLSALWKAGYRDAFTLH